MKINDFIESVMVRSEIEHGSTPVYIRTMGNMNSELQLLILDLSQEMV